jgi:hypothetical protein
MIHTCSFAAREGIQLKGSTKNISEQKVSAIFQWQGQQKKHIWAEGFRPSLHAQT